MTPALMTSRERKRALRYAGPFYAESRADGTILLKPAWSGVGHPPECPDPISRDADGDCIYCGTPHLPGVFDRMAVAEAVEETLNAMLRVGRPRGPQGQPKGDDHDERRVPGEGGGLH